MRARKRSSAGGSGSGTDSISSERGAGSGAGQASAVAGRPSQPQRDLASSPGVIVPRSGVSSEPLPGQGSTAEEAAAAAADAAAEAAVSQQWADRFGSRDSGGEARDVIRDPVAAVRKWQEALFGADLED